MMEDTHKRSTRIFKKSTVNGKITMYLGKRDFIDHLTHVDPVEGVVLIDPEYVKDRKVFIQLLGAFWFGKDELDLLDLSYHRDISLLTKQLYPTIVTEVMNANSHTENTSNFHSYVNCRELSRLQERLIRKLGVNAHPFRFYIRPYSPASVSMIMNPSDQSKRCRIDYELKVYLADDKDEKAQKRNSVRMAIRKLTFAPTTPGQQPSAELSRDFLMSVGSLRVEATLDKHRYFHDETIFVNLLVDNNSNKTIKRIKIAVRQYTQVNYQNIVNYKCTVAEIHSEEGCPISPSQTGWCKVYRLCPALVNNRHKIGLALDGDLKQEDTNLASSTILPGDGINCHKVGIVVHYKVKVRLVLGFGISDVCIELPFLLTHDIMSSNEVDDNSSDPPTSYSHKEHIHNRKRCSNLSTSACTSVTTTAVTTNSLGITNSNNSTIHPSNLLNDHINFNGSQLSDTHMPIAQQHSCCHVSTELIPLQESHQQKVDDRSKWNYFSISPSTCLPDNLFHPDQCQSGMDRRDDKSVNELTNVSDTIWGKFNSTNDAIGRNSRYQIGPVTVNIPHTNNPSLDSLKVGCNQDFNPFRPNIPALINGHPSPSEAKLMMSEDDLLFEDFARFRLQCSVNRSGVIPY